MSSLVGIIWDVGGGGSQYPFERDLPAPLTLYPLLFSGIGVPVFLWRLLDGSSDSDADGAEPSAGLGQGDPT